MLKCIVRTTSVPLGIDVAKFGFCLEDRPQIVVADYKTTVRNILARDGEHVKKHGLNDKVMSFPFNALEDFNIKPLLREFTSLLMDATEIELSDEDLIYTVKNTVIGPIDNEVEEYASFVAQFTVSGYEKSTITRSMDLVGFKSYEIFNQGTYKSWPILRAEFHSDCGYLSFMTERGQMLIGNFNEADKVFVGDSERLLDEKFVDGVSSWDYANIDPKIYHNFAGSFGGEFAINEDGVYLVSKQTSAEVNDKGQEIGYPRFDNSATIVKKFAEDAAGDDTADNWEIECQFRFQEPVTGLNDEDNYNQAGVLTIGVMDENQTPLVYTTVMDINPGPTDAQISFDGYNSMTEERFNFGKLYESQDDNYKQVSRNYYGAIKIHKKGNLFEFSVLNEMSGFAEGGTVIKQYVNNEFASRKAKYAFLYMGQRNGKDVRDYMEIHNFLMIKHHSSNIADIRNAFMDGDVLEVDHQNGEIKLNGFPYNATVAMGSRFWWLNPGKNLVRVDYSDWATLPSIKMAYRENWR